MDSVRDLAACVVWLTAHGDADPTRIAVMGGSYGGFMTLAAVTNYPDLWAAGVDIVGIANWRTFLENTGPFRRKHREAEYGNLEEDGEFLDSISPIHKADAIRAPMIILHGANDPRVPVGESEQIVAILHDREVPVVYHRYPDEGHGLVKLPNKVHGYTAIGDFLDEYVMRG
jgi:dipeptidyl aminopeptidase/acylaminoacyl peptidase